MRIFKGSHSLPFSLVVAVKGLKSLIRFFRVHSAGRGGSKGGLQPPYCWCINGNMGRVREKKRWKKEEKMERWWKKKRSAPPSILFCIRHCLSMSQKCFDYAIILPWKRRIAKGPKESLADE